jgi:hypothetical protein
VITPLNFRTMVILGETKHEDLFSLEGYHEIFLDLFLTCMNLTYRFSFSFLFNAFLCSATVIIYNCLDSDTTMLHGKLMEHDI